MDARNAPESMERLVPAPLRPAGAEYAGCTHTILLSDIVHGPHPAIRHESPPIDNAPHRDLVGKIGIAYAAFAPRAIDV